MQEVWTEKPLDKDNKQYKHSTIVSPNESQTYNKERLNEFSFVKNSFCFQK